MPLTSLPMPVFKRLTTYLNFLNQLPPDAPVNISATGIADAVGLNHVLVRKDLSSVSDKGKPKVGYVVDELVTDIKHFLQYDTVREAVLVGAGNMGKALLSYKGLKRYGLEIVATFDNDLAIIGKEVYGQTILPADKIENLCKRLKITIGIITVPTDNAQEACDRLVAGGVKGLWNFAPINLKAPDDIVIQNEDMASSLAILINKLAKNQQPHTNELETLV